MNATSRQHDIPCSHRNDEQTTQTGSMWQRSITSIGPRHRSDGQGISSQELACGRRWPCFIDRSDEIRASNLASNIFVMTLHLGLTGESPRSHLKLHRHGPWSWGVGKAVRKLSCKAVRKPSCKAVQAIHPLPHVRTHVLAKRTATSAHDENPFMNRWLCCEPQQASGVYPVENLYLVDTRAVAPTEFDCVLDSNCLLYCCAEPYQTTSDLTIIVN